MTGCADALIGLRCLRVVESIPIDSLIDKVLGTLTIQAERNLL